MRARVALVASLLGATSSVALAEPCPPPTDLQIEARITEVNRIFDDHEGPMTWWWTGFMGFHAAMAAGMSIVYNTQDSHARQETAVGLVGSALGATTLFFVDPPLMRRASDLDPLPRDTPDARRRYLKVAESMLEEQANKSRFARSWLAHGMAFAYTTGAAIFVWLALDRPIGGLRNFLGGLVIGQGRILLHPTGAADAWDAYEERHIENCGEAPETARVTPDPWPQIQFGGAPGGISVTITF